MAAGAAIASSTAAPLTPDTGDGYRLLDVKTARFELMQLGEPLLCMEKSYAWKP